MKSEPLTYIMLVSCGEANFSASLSDSICRMSRLAPTLRCTVLTPSVHISSKRSSCLSVSMLPAVSAPEQ